MFHREPTTPRSVDDVARALYVRPEMAAELLASLCQAGFLERPGEQFVYAPRDPALSDALGRLAEVYFTDLIAVTELIHDRTHKTASRFAAAFRLRKDS